MRRLVYFIRVAAQNLFRNGTLTLVSAATIALALMILGAFLLVQVNLQKLAATSAQGLSVYVYLDEEVDGEGVAALEAAFRAMPQIEDIDFIDKKEAMADLRRQLGANAQLLDDLAENPLPASFELTLKPDLTQSGRADAVIDRLEAAPGVSAVDYAWEWAEKLAGIIHFVKLAGWIVGGMLFLAVVLITANTIRLAAASREGELYVLRLMGAAESFIRTPFVLEGAVQGLVGGALALGMLFALYWLFAGALELPFGFLQIKWTFLPRLWAAFIVLSGAGLGLLGAMMSFSRVMRR